MRKLILIARNWLQKEEGASIVEYALLLTLIAIVTLAIISLLGNAISNFFVSAAGSI
jgi:pilus assembly protein Flp/PilA